LHIINIGISCDFCVPDKLSELEEAERNFLNMQEVDGANTKRKRTTLKKNAGAPEAEVAKALGEKYVPPKLANPKKIAAKAQRQVKAKHHTAQLREDLNLLNPKKKARLSRDSDCDEPSEVLPSKELHDNSQMSEGESVDNDIEETGSDCDDVEVIDGINESIGKKIEQAGNLSHTLQRCACDVCKSLKTFGKSNRIIP